MQKSRIKGKIKSLPKSSGVYVFYGAKKEILYVGKATSLRDRVRSYFNSFSPFGKGGLKGDLKNPGKLKIPLFFGHLPLKKGENYERPIDYAINQITDIKIIQTDTVIEAFILEQNLIKKLQPKYNAMGKDDKSFAYVVLTKEEWPRFMIIRKTDLEAKYVIASEAKQSRNLKRDLSKIGIAAVITFPRNDNVIFGPYTSKKNIEIVLRLLKRIFPFHSSAQKTEKGCLDFELGRCPGPYAGAITRVDYLKNIRGIRMILEGKKRGLVKKLEKEMKSHSKFHEYEKAAESRNKLFALKHINDVALISQNMEHETWNKKDEFRIEAYDISNISGQHAVGSMVVFKNNEPDKNEYRKFKIKTIQDSDDVGMMKEVLTRRFGNNWPTPDLILLDGGIGHLNMTEELFKDLRLNIPLVAVAKGINRKKLDLRFRNKDFGSDISNLFKDRNLIKRIMDEAHRFAITYHRKVRKKEFISINSKPKVQNLKP